MSLPRITDSFVCVDDCPVCLGGGIVCEEHPDKAWMEGDGCCGMPGAPCPHVQCRFANDAKIVYDEYLIPREVDGEVVAVVKLVRWPCGTEAEVDHGGRLYVDELRALHRTALLSRLTS